MRLLVLGADGMLGHQVVESLRKRFDVHGTVRLNEAAYAGISEFLPPTVYYSIDVRDHQTLHRLLDSVRPDAVINAVGIVKQRAEAEEAIASIEINALLPHRLALHCGAIGARLLHVSTDCVFSGHGGMYREDSPPDAQDLYGRTKLLGEVANPGSITLRTSIIGLELTRRKSLIEWFLAQKTGRIKGFRKAIYSGFTTIEMARIIELVLIRAPERSGVYHVASKPIDKFTLLRMLRDKLCRSIEIIPDDDFLCDRSLDGSRFRRDFAYTAPSWGSMLDELSGQIRNRHR
jgi:dTDP-4-dehydrorhamnose reductase